MGQPLAILGWATRRAEVVVERLAQEIRAVLTGA